MKCMKEMPPADFVVGAWAKSKAPKPLGEQLGFLGKKVRKGKVRKRGD